MIRRLRRSFLNVLAALSMLLCVAALALSVRGQFRSDVHSLAGEWRLELHHGWLVVRHPTPAERVADSLRKRVEPCSPRKLIWHPGCHPASATRATIDPPRVQPRLVPLRLPYAAIVAAGALLLAARALSPCGTRRRFGRSECPVC